MVQRCRWTGAAKEDRGRHLPRLSWNACLGEGRALNGLWPRGGRGFPVTGGVEPANPATGVCVRSGAALIAGFAMLSQGLLDRQGCAGFGVAKAQGPAPCPHSPLTPEVSVRDPRHAILFQPLAIGPVTAPNRFYQAPHCNCGGDRDPPAATTLRGVRAEGGWRVIFTEQTESHPTSAILAFPTPNCETSSA